MRPNHVLKWVDLMYLDIQAILDNKIPQFGRILLQLLAGINVINQRRAKQLNILSRETSAIGSLATAHSSHPISSQK